MRQRNLGQKIVDQRGYYVPKSKRKPELKKSKDWWLLVSLGVITIVLIILLK